MATHFWATDQTKGALWCGHQVDCLDSFSREQGNNNNLSCVEQRNGYAMSPEYGIWAGALLLSLVTVGRINTPTIE